MSELHCHESSLLGEKYYETIHRSGLKILIFPKKLTTCHAVLGVKFGSTDFCYRNGNNKIMLPDGTAHFLEHKMFENEDGVNSDERFTALGAEANAYTTYTSTRYLFSATRNYNKCLRELLRYVTHPYFTHENVAKERGIIKQEIMMYIDDPYERVIENCMRAMYSKSGVRKSICGSVSSIAKINDKLLYETHKAFYNVQNMILSVCGDITPEQVIDAADCELPADCLPFTAEKLGVNEPEGVARSYIQEKMCVSRPLFFIGIKDRVIEDKILRIRRSLYMTVLNNMLFSGTGELYNRLLTERLITPGFSFGYSSGSACAMNYFSGNSDDPKKVYDELRNKAFSAAAGNLNADDFKRCRRSLLASFYKAFDSSAEIADDVMLSYVSAGVDPFDIPGIIESLTLEETAAAAAELYRNENFTLSVILPLQKGI